jgi:diacylglycerol kinase (ATP)
VAKPENTGIRRLLRATVYSFQGLHYALKNEAAFRQELALTVIMTPMAIWLGGDIIERIMLIAVLLFVLVVELVNSAIEAVVDRHGPEVHELSGAAKDLGSAAVFVSLMIVILVWGSVIYDRFYA